MLSLSLVTAAVIAPALVAAQTPYFRSPFILTNPIQLDGKKCVTPSGGNAVAGATLTIATCNKSAGQQITWSGTTVKSGNLCWSAKSGSATVTLATCNSSDSNQSWYFNKFGGRQVKHNNTGRCLHLAGGNTAAGTAVQVQACNKGIAEQIWNVGYEYGTQPSKVAADPSGQFGTNQCGTNSSSTANCDNVWLNDINDFCIWAPPSVGTVGDQEHKVVAYCLKSGRGTRLIPDGTFKGVHFIKTSSYVQINGVGDFTKVNIKKGDAGGELDPHGATASGNPVGGLVYGNVHGPNVQYHEWSSFISSNEFCFRACLGKDSQKDCPHIYDVMGCYWNQPGNYNPNVYESCLGDKTLPAGIYGTSTFHQGDPSTPGPHPTAASSQCVKQSTVKNSPLTSTSTTTTTTTTSSTSTSTPPAGTGKPIRSGANSSKCLAAASVAKGAKIIIQDCTGAANQLFTRVGNTFRVAGFCIDVIDGNTAKGAQLQIWSCGSGNVNQQFSYDANGDKHITWINSSVQRSIDVTNGVFTNGNPLQLWQRSTTTANQLWTF